MFRLIADQSRRSNQRKLGLLLSDCIQVPRVLGEAQAFGGVNIDPSVRSCFEKAGDSDLIEALNFLNWMKQEPQSMVWLPVLHRLEIFSFLNANVDYFPWILSRRESLAGGFIIMNTRLHLPGYC